MEPRDELAQFLRTRRASLKPEAVGLPVAGRRRTPGLRREEVALLAGVSVSWYTWLEQGRPIRASHEVLRAIARTLQLTPTERAHLLALADRAEPAVATAESDRAPDQLVRLIEAMSPSPAYVLGPRWEFLAWNRAQALLFPAIERLAPPERNLLWVVFATAEARSLIIDWPIEAQRMLTQFRADTDRLHDDAPLQELIARLNRVSPEFAEGWARHDVAPVREPRPAVCASARRHVDLRIPTAGPGRVLAPARRRAVAGRRGRFDPTPRRLAPGRLAPGK